MSCFEWEQGTIKIPTSEWKTFRERIISAHNKSRIKLFDKANALYEWIKANKKRGENIFAYNGAFDRAWEALTIHADDETRYEVQQFVEINGKGKSKLQKPKKKDMKLLPLSKSANISFSDGEGHISLDNKTRQVHWGVDENNHSCDNARAHDMGVAFFDALRRVTWKRGSGGSIVGNDEYNRDARGDEEGGNYSKGEYGVNAKSPRRRR